MDLNKLYYLRHWLDYSNFSINLENYTILTNSLLLLQNENHFKKVFFWGIIYGIEAYYYISFGYKIDAILDRIFYYSDDCQNWKLLPVPEYEHIALTELCKTPFQGDPGLVIEIVDDAPEELIPDDSDTESYIPQEYRIPSQKQLENRISFDGEVVNDVSTEDGEANGVGGSNLSKDLNQHELGSKPQPVTSGMLKEEDRLGAIIKIITEETAIVPRGGLFKQSDGTHVHSRAFEGLRIDDANELCSFQHYRLPQQDWNTNLMARVDYNYAIDFLDTIDKDIPTDCWSAQLVEGDRLIVIRSLLWPEFMFFHHLETPDHGFIYVGYGQRNLDVPFMTQIDDKIELEPGLDLLKTPSRFLLATQIPVSEEDLTSDSITQ